MTIASNSESNHSDPIYIERLRLFQTLNRLPESQFEALIFALDVPADIRPSALAPRGNRSSEVLNWVESPTGPQLPRFRSILDDILGLSSRITEGQCPYKGLSYFDFNDEDYKYFYGRESLTEALLNKIEHSNFTAIVGASGSGKSSVLRAGLLQQLKHSDRNEICILTPGENPLQNLALAFVDKSQSRSVRAIQQQQNETLLNQGADGLRRLVQNSDTQRVILVVDQFEEAFTLCQETTLRRQFFETLLGAVAAVNSQLCVILAMRSDFVGRCFEQHYGGLADQVQNNLVAVLPMQRSELDKAITGPANSVGLKIESELVKQLLDDVESSPGNLPLLQYTLQELWKQRQGNTLELKTYVKLGGVTGTLQKRADAVYNALDPKQQETARHIFLNLTQPGESTEDTRRRVPQSSLVTAQDAESTITEVVKKLADAKLIVTSEEISGTDGSRVAIVDVAHEALIRHWNKLQDWLDSSREALIKQRSIENSAKDWAQHDWSKDYLLQGTRLLEVEEFIQKNPNDFPLSKLGQDFFRSSKQQRQKTKIKEKRIQYGFLSLGLAIVSIIIIATQRELTMSLERRTLFDVFVGGAANSPRSLEVANLIAEVAAQLAKSGYVDKASNYYSSVLRVTQDLQAIKDADKAYLDRVRMTQMNAESNLAQLVRDNYLPDLASGLRTKKFGKLKDNPRVTDFEEQYTEGALKTTYRILMREPGLRSDLNQNGFLDPNEKNLMPCETLKDIEALWRHLTDNHCGFQENDDYYISQSCDELSNYTLTHMIFPRPLDSAIERLKTCGVSQSNHGI